MSQQKHNREYEKKEIKEQQKEQPDDVDLTPKEHERALKLPYRSLVVPV